MVKKQEVHDGVVEIFCAYIRRAGKIIYPKNGGAFHFFVKA